MKLLFTPEALVAFNELKTSNSREADQVKDTIKEILSHPFYNIDNETFEVACGKWLQKYPHVYDMILKEFDLPSERTTAKYAIHWDIGHSWR